MLGEDVEDHGGAVDHRHAERLLEVALLARLELVVGNHHVGVGLLDRLLQLRQLALAEVAVRIGLRAALVKVAGHRHAGGAQQLAQLRELGLLRPGGDQEGALAGSRVADALAVVDH